jgi:iron complex outermembrane recepter protein
MKRLSGSILFAFFLISSLQVFAESTTQDPSLEELLKTDITSVSKKEKQLFDTPAAVYVVTREEIRSSGARNVPDALRLVPGMEVSQINASTWSVGVRGFDERFSNKMLVMIDGRSLYSPIFGGINWDSIDLVMEDIDRIEVIRGPGGSLWGSNAVNGTVNIITRSSQATQGALISEVSASDAPVSLAARYGGQAGKLGTYRIFSKYTDSFGNQNAAGHWAGDAWHMLHGGFRMDLKPRQHDALMLEGDMSGGSFGEPLSMHLMQAPWATAIGGVNSPLGGTMLGRWTRDYSNGQETQVQVYYSKENRDATERPDHLNTVDVDAQHHFHIGSRQDFVAGAGYRYSQVYAPSTYFLTINPASQDFPLFSGFIQDEITLIPKKLALTAGGKLEHNRFTGFDFQPSVRVNWRPTGKQDVWAAVSQAVKTPNLLNTSMNRMLSASVGSDGLNVTTYIGNPQYKDERLLAYEGGYRLQLKRVSIDAAGFLNRYNDAETTEPLPPVLPTVSQPYTLNQTQWANNDYGRSLGAEVAASWNVISRWKLTASYSWLKIELRPNSISQDRGPGSSSAGFNTGTPTNRFGVRSSYALLKNLQFNTSAQYAGPLPSGDAHDLTPAVPSYYRVDSNLQWHVGEYVRLDFGGQNLLAPRHAEYGGGNGAIQTLSTRNIFGRVTYAF